MKEQRAPPHAVNGERGGWRGRSDATPGPPCASMCSHLSVGVQVWDWVSKSAGERRHMRMDGAVPCQLQEIQGLLRGRACLLCKHVHVYMCVCFHINSGAVVPHCLAVELVGTR